VLTAFPPQTWPAPSASTASVLLTTHGERVTPFCADFRYWKRFYCAIHVLHRTIIFGRSTGGGLAVRAAASYGPCPAITWIEPAMRLSRSFIPTMRETPAEAQIASHRLMLRAGLVRQISAGIYAWLPLGYRVLRNIERIVREEQNAAGAQEAVHESLSEPELAGLHFEQAFHLQVDG